MIISQTPLRVSFLGGGSDLPAYYQRQGGAVLATAIQQSVYITVSRKFDDAIRISYSQTEEVSDAAQVQHPIVRECLDFLQIKGGIEITSVADIPAHGTGLGSSSSFTVGLLNALHAYCERYASATRLAEESFRIETRCTNPIGKQDQYSAAFGGFNLLRFNPDESVEVHKILCTKELLSELRAKLMLFYTGITRPASGILQEQAANLAGNTPQVKALDRIVALAETVYRDLQANRLDTLGPALDESWQLKKQLAKGISVPLIDDAYSAALAAGAEGGKLLGAGGGGFLLFVVSPEKQMAVRKALHGLKMTRFEFAPQGSRIIFVHSGWDGKNP